MIEAFKKLTGPQIWAQARHVITFIAGIAVALGLLTATSSKELIDGAMTALDSLEKIAAALVVLGGGVTTIINALAASRRASPQAAVQTVQEIANDPNQPQTVEAKQALVQATNSIPEVKGVLTTDTAEGKALAMSVPETTIVPAGTIAAVEIAKEGT